MSAKSAKSATTQYRLSKWLPIIKECRASGMTVRSWCTQNSVDEKQFYYWQRKIREIASESLPAITQDSRFVQLPVATIPPPTTKQSSSAFVPTMVIRVGKAVIELTDHVQPELLTSVLKVLSDA